MERHVNPEDPDLYALGALDGEEKQAFEAHVRTCAACAAEVEAARARIAMLGLAAPPVVPARHVKEALMRRVREERPRETSQPERSEAFRKAPAPVRSRRFAWLTPVLAAATILLAVAGGWLWTRDEQDVQRIHALEAQLSAAQSRSLEIAQTAAETDRILGAPGTIHVALAQQPGQPAGRAGVLYNPRLGTVLYAGRLSPAPADKSYQLWLVPATGAPVSLGVFSSSEETAELTAHVAPGTAAKAFAITVEPKGGRPQPTGPKVLVGVPG